MGIFEFLKKIAKTSKAEEIVIEKLAFSEIEDWIKRNKEENEIKEKEVLFKVEEKIENMIPGLRVKIVALEGFDVEAKKQKDRIKNLVIESRKKYIESVEDLIERLNNLEEPKLEKFIEKINKIFFDFNKSSFKNYEIATILIGREMGDIKGDLKVFSKNLLKTFDESKPIIDSFKNLLIIKEKLNTINPINRTLEEISEKKSNLNKRINDKEEENRILKQSLEKIKTSSDYLERLKTQKKIESLKEELKDDIFRLRQLLDFKALANFFHINGEQLSILKDHKEDFQTHFKKDNGKMIIDLLDEAKLNKNTILEKVNLIRTKTEETSNYEKELMEDETQEVYFKIKEVRLEIDGLKIENVKEEKRDEKIRANKEELIDSLKQVFGAINVEVI